jgi:DivIVA domain-containing protein
MPPAITAKLDKPTVAGGPTTLRLKLGTEHAVVARPKFWNDTLEVDGIAVKRASYVEGFCSFHVTHGDESVVVALNVTRTTSGATYEYSFTDLSVGGKAVRIEGADVLAPGQAPSTLTPTEVSNVRFTPVRLREGYDMVEVDKFLDLIEGELAARYVALANTAATSVPSFAFAGNDISEKRFTTVRLREGYDMGEVDRFLDRAEESVRTLDARLGIKE